ASNTRAPLLRRLCPSRTDRAERFPVDGVWDSGGNWCGRGSRTITPGCSNCRGRRVFDVRNGVDDRETRGNSARRVRVQRWLPQPNPHAAVEGVRPRARGRAGKPEFRAIGGVVRNSVPSLRSVGRARAGAGARSTRTDVDRGAAHRFDVDPDAAASRAGEERVARAARSEDARVAKGQAQEIELELRSSPQASPPRSRPPSKG